MREIDRRTKVSRRLFLRSTAAGMPAAALAAAGASISATAAWAQDAKALQPRTMATLVLMARDIYPHDHIADTYYIQAVAPWDGKAAADSAVKTLLEDGVALLNGTAQAKCGAAYLDVPWEEQRVAVLQAIEPTPFFQKIKGDLIVSFYNNHDLWPKFGYEGSSADKGGYIHRGFSDIDWLPQS
jgi:hypothetical protein